jgi:hypothetical protein
MTEEILTYEEVVALLSEQARAGKVAALVSLERARAEWSSEASYSRSPAASRASASPRKGSAGQFIGKVAFQEPSASSACPESEGWK